MRFLGSLFVAFGLLFPLTAAAQTGLMLPVNDGYVTDAVGILTMDQDSELEKMIAEYRDQTSNEIAIVVLRDLGGADPSDVGVDIGRRWGVGDSKKNNGIVILVDHSNQQVYMSVGYGLEGALPDIVAKGIVEQDIVPQFRSGAYYEGLKAALLSIQKHTSGEYTADRYTQTAETSGGFGVWALFLAFLGFEWLLAILGRTKSWWLGGVLGGCGGIFLAVTYGWWLSIPVLVIFGAALDFIVSQNYRSRGPTSWWAGGTWAPGRGGVHPRSRGNIRRFGGGSFGGGGAGGRW